MYFLGDSVTAGFGYCGWDEGGFAIKCPANQELSDSWLPGLEWNLWYCAPPKAAPPTNRCSNNNRLGAPWDSPPWSKGPDNPSVAYSYQIGGFQSVDNFAVIRNWAMTGSIPADWAPIAMPPPAFANQLPKIADSHVVMTLGANPILSEYLSATGHVFTLMEGEPCAAKTKIGSFAAPLTDEGDGAGACLLERWNFHAHGIRLSLIYRTLLEQHNRVVVVGYPAVSPWSFGAWQPDSGKNSQPWSGLACSQVIAAIARNGALLSQLEQAMYLGARLNALLKEVVDALAQSYPDDIIFVAQSDQWGNHQAWMQDSWVFQRDTWIHPSVLGHQQIAYAVMKSMCAKWQRWCLHPNTRSYPWKPAAN